MNENLVILEKMLQTHDWTHEYSDDHRQYIKGRNELDAINKEQRRLISDDLVPVDKIIELTDKYRPKNT